MEVLDACTKGLENTNNVQGEPLASLLVMMARRQFQLGDAAGGRKRLDAYLEVADKNTTRYAGDYPLYLRKQQLQRVAGEFVRAGLWSDALAALARYVDAPAYSGGDPPVDDTLDRRRTAAWCDSSRASPPATDSRTSSRSPTRRRPPRPIPPAPSTPRTTARPRANPTS
jgi:hypothetical protein